MLKIKLLLNNFYLCALSTFKSYPMRILFCLLFVSLIATDAINAQKVTFDKKSSIASIDETAAFKVERSGLKDYYFTVRNLVGDKLFLANYRYNESDYGNGWFEFVFLSMEEKVTVKYNGGASRKFLAKYIVKNELIKDGELNVQAAKEFILVKEFEPLKEVRIVTD